MPDPLREKPPEDHYCDILLNGGVASGVAYPWALLHLARHYRFKSVGGNSVGAMAATLAAAAEYGRCHGNDDAFEPLRYLPVKLAGEKVVNGVPQTKTKMLRLFQPSKSVQRLFDLFIAFIGWSNPGRKMPAVGQNEDLSESVLPFDRVSVTPVLEVLRIYGFGWLRPLVTPALRWLRRLDRHRWLLPLGVTLILAAAILSFECQESRPWIAAAALIVVIASALLLILLLIVVVIGLRFYRDLQALGRNNYGLCTGIGPTEADLGQRPADDTEGLVEWLHRGIQLSAGRGREDPPLTFADLWSAPRFGRAGPAPLQGGLQPPDPGIELQMFSSNVTLGRPVRLPLNDANTRLFFDPKEWERYFPPSVLAALGRASRPYSPASPSDPDPDAAGTDPAQRRLMQRLLELPSGGMPIVVAARLSLSFPLLFSCVPVYAVDYQDPRDRRNLRKCLLSDGGLCTNFPIHLFDAAHPQWPTFAFLFDDRRPAHADEPVWLPKDHLSGRADNWIRGVPGAEDEGRADRPILMRLFGLAGGLLLTMKDWNDRVTARLPQVRNRVIHLALRKGEGQLNLTMSRETILTMAYEYGTRAGIELVNRYDLDAEGQPAVAWRQHLYVRSMIELRALRQHLSGYTSSVRSAGDTVPLRQLLRDAMCVPPMRTGSRPTDPTGGCLSKAQFDALERAVTAVEALEAELAACEAEFGPYRPVLEPELRLRPPT
jgi:predicted acylesterase/phospholipase RssA